MTVLRKLSSAEAECVINHLTSWAKLQLQDKDHISDEVTRGMSCVFLCICSQFSHFMWFQEHQRDSLNSAAAADRTLI